MMARANFVLTEIYILKDREGYVSSCAPTRHALSVEASRRPLSAPIKVYHWTQSGRWFDSSMCGWRLKETWVWEGAPF